MKNRTNNLLSNRINIETVKLNGSISSNEYFQNNTIRPVVKYQHELLIHSFINYIKKHKYLYLNLSTINKLNYIDTALQKDNKFRNTIIGIIIGAFTIEEYIKYLDDSSALNKRIVNIIAERLKTNLLRYELKSNL